MGIEEVEGVVKWYYGHIDGRAYSDAFAAAVAPYLERRKQGIRAIWRHRYE